MKCRVWWNSPKSDKSLEMGDFLSEKTAKNSIPNLKAKLMAQCRNDEQKAAIEAGSWEIEAIDEP